MVAVMEVATEAVVIAAAARVAVKAVSSVVQKVEATAALHLSMQRWRWRRRWRQPPAEVEAVKAGEAVSSVVVKIKMTAALHLSVQHH